MVRKIREWRNEDDWERVDNDDWRGLFCSYG
jgi:hypothetical protein